MNFSIIGDSDCPLAAIYLNQGETVKIERGAMAYMANVELSGKMNARSNGLKGVFGAIGRSITSGESIFITEAMATADNAVIGIAPAIPGKIQKLTVGEKQYRLNTGAFLACDSSVNYQMKAQSLGKALFGGTGGMFVMETEGTGDILVSAFGDLLELTISEDKSVIIDNQHVVAWDRTLDYKIEIASGTFGFKTGEGLVNRFTGNGHVFIQTRNLLCLANALQVYFPDKNNE